MVAMIVRMGMIMIAIVNALHMMVMTFLRRAHLFFIADDGTHGSCCKHVADFVAIHAAVITQEGPQKWQPCSPNGILEKHHEG